MRPTKRANPGPKWGYEIMLLAEKYLPRGLFEIFVKAGVWVAVLVMTEQRQNSKYYWKLVTGNQASLRNVFDHFYSFSKNLVLKLQAGRGHLPKLKFSETVDTEPYKELCLSDQPALFGTFHVGYSDMMGCMLNEFDRKVRMLRIQVENSLDTEILKETFSSSLEFLWVNETDNFIFQLKEAIEKGESIAIQCDRIEIGSKTASFDFLGKKYSFPLTIYYLSALFQLPVTFAFTGPLSQENEIEVVTSSVFKPYSNRAETIKNGKIHFQETLELLEKHLRIHPELWFNFTSLNSVTKGGDK